MSTASSSVPSAAEPAPVLFQLRGGAYTLLVLRMADPKDPRLFQQLANKIAQAPNFYRNAPVVIDLSSLDHAWPFNLAELGRRLRQHQLVVVGVQNGTEEQNKAAVNAGWSILPDGRPAPLREPQVVVAPAAAPAAPDPVPSVAPAQPAQAARTEDAGADAASPARLVVAPVRSGRRVYAQGGDLIVLASISAGAELLADGHIHVYGALRGRALAGVAGDTSARIFCRALEAELVSIAGYWRVREDIPEALIGKPAQVFLDGERIAIEPLT